MPKSVTAFDNIDKNQTVLSATAVRVSIISVTSIVGAPAGTASANLVLITLIFSLTTGIIKKSLSITRNKKKKQDKTLVLAKGKLSSIETLVPQALIDMDISHEEFVTILNETDKYEKMKENMKNLSEKQEHFRLNSISSITQKITRL